MADIAGSKLTTLTTIAAGAGVIPAANLTSVAQKGANSDITSLSGLSTPISVAQGGTDSTAAKNTAGGVVVPTGAVNAASGAVVLDASSKLPAVDGSLLTGISAFQGFNRGQAFTGSGTWTKPAGVTQVFVTACGGGGGAGGYHAAGAGGGGGGAYGQADIAVTGNVTVTVGAGGAGGGNGSNGSVGGNSSFAGTTTLTAGGGGAGTINPAGGGAGGTNTNADVDIPGTARSNALGGNSFLGIGGELASSGKKYGGGGGGGTSTSTSGGSGIIGIVIVQWNE